jgi:hypothetical protein
MSSITTYFSQKDNLQNVLLDNLNKAKHTVQVAVAWFTDVILFNKLLELQNKGVKIELIITKHQFNDQSRNDYSKINQNGGIFIEIGGDYNTMHHKFCIIDHRILLQGSFNWTRKANESNNETLILIAGDNNSINEFTGEFNRLKRLAGMTQEIHELEIAAALKYFSLIKALIEIGRTDEINPYLHEIKDIKELQTLINFLFNEQYDEAISEINKLTKQYTGVVNHSILVKEELIFRIKLISEQIKHLEIEKTEIEEEIGNFNRRYILELNPILAEIIRIKKKILEKIKSKGQTDKTIEELTEEFEKIQEDIQNEEAKNVIELTDVEKKSLKDLYHESATLCHPDSSKCVIKDKKQAEEVFAKLSIAYKAKDFETVKQITEELRLGSVNINNIGETEIIILQAKLATLEKKFNKIFIDIESYKTKDPFLTISQIKNMDKFFEDQKTLLTKQQEDLKQKFMKS